MKHLILIISLILGATGVSADYFNKKQGLKKMLKKLLIILTIINPNLALGVHYNAGNILRECKNDTSFNSNCRTYIAAYSDLLAFIFSVQMTDEERYDLASCFSIMTNAEIAEAVRNIGKPANDTIYVHELLLKQVCQK